MNWIKACAEADLPQGARKRVQIEGNDILILWHEDQIHAVSNKCPHMGLPLEKGKVTDENTLVCPWHKSAFDLDTGDVKAWSPWPPGLGKLLGCLKKETALKIFPAKVENGEILVQV